MTTIHTDAAMKGEAGFTPGPWKRFAHPDPDCAAISIGGADDDFSSGHTTCYRNVRANARLITAAPELLAALQASECLLSTFSRPDDPDDIVGQAVLKMARAAIASATGAK